MKKVLIIGCIWLFHKGGARTPGLANYLSECGWEPVVLTQPISGKPALRYRVVEVPYHSALDFWLRLFGFGTGRDRKSVRQIVNGKLNIKSRKSFKKSILDFIFLRLNEILTYPDIDTANSWKPPAIKAGIEILEKEDIKAIISISPPVTSNLIARELKASYNIPWIADLPHLWSQNNGYPFNFLRRLIDRRLELKTLSQADALITTSEPLAAKLKTLHKEMAIYVITHGFDPDTINTPPDKVTDKFTITYTGDFVPVFREPSWLLEALRNLIDKDVVEKDRVEVRFFGNKEPWVETEIGKYGLSGIVKHYGRIPIQAARAKQRESQVLFNPKWNDPQEPGIHSLKIFEYLAARRPILVIGDYKDVVDDLLDETGAGISVNTIEGVEHALGELYQEYKQKGEVAFRGDTTAINKYSQRELAGEFSQILDHLA